MLDLIFSLIRKVTLEYSSILSLMPIVFEQICLKLDFMVGFPTEVNLSIELSQHFVFG